MFIKPYIIKEYFFCKYILFYYKNNYKFNQNNFHLKEGKLYDEEINKNISFDFFKIDEIDYKNKIIYERKKSFSNQIGSEFQLLYYLYLTKKIFPNYIGVLETYNKKINVKIILTKEKEEKLLLILKEINNIYININKNFLPKKELKDKCKECNFNDYCLI